MSCLSNYLQNKLIDQVFRGQAFSFPATLYMALFTVQPTAAGGGTEVSGTGYARVPFVGSLADWAGTQGAGTTVASSGTSGATSNNAVINFGSPTAAWGVVVGFAIFDAATGGNMLMFGALNNSKSVNANDAAPAFPAGTLAFSIS
jgi:hypothetical protein